jgi:hypothetical protein
MNGIVKIGGFLAILKVSMFLGMYHRSKFDKKLQALNSTKSINLEF